MTQCLAFANIFLRLRSFTASKLNVCLPVLILSRMKASAGYLYTACGQRLLGAVGKQRLLRITSWPNDSWCFQDLSLMFDTLRFMPGGYCFRSILENKSFDLLRSVVFNCFRHFWRFVEHLCRIMPGFLLKCYKKKLLDDNRYLELPRHNFVSLLE